MEKKELREKTFAIYRKMYKTDKKPDVLELAKMLNILTKAISFCSDAEDELGSDLYALIKKCTRVEEKTSVDVEISKFMNAIGYFEED